MTSSGGHKAAAEATARPFYATEPPLRAAALQDVERTVRRHLGPSGFAHLDPHLVARQKLRKIVIGSDRFLWRVHHRHVSAEEDRVINPCAEVFTAFLEGHTRARARVFFPETSEHGPGHISQAGVVLDYQRPEQPINLNLPRVARLVIELAIVEGWSPSTSATEFTIDNGYDMFRAHHAQLEHALAGNTTS